MLPKHLLRAEQILKLTKSSYFYENIKQHPRGLQRSLFINVKISFNVILLFHLKPSIILLNITRSNTIQSEVGDQDDNCTS